VRWRAKSRQSEIRSVSAPRFPMIALAAALALSVAAIVFCVWLLFHGYFPGRSQAKIAGVGPAQEKSVAVLPFENLSDEKQNAYFADGIQDQILSDLAKVADLKVISRTSVLQYKTGVSRNLRAIASDLGVANILEGTVQRIGGRIKVSAQLIEAKTDAHIWADQYERDLADVFQMQNEVAEKIVTQLKAKLSPNEKTAIEERPTADLAAYHFYLQARDLIFGIAFSARGKESLLQAVQLLEQAIALDPSFFLAYCQLAGAHDRIYFLGFDHTEERLKMADQALRAVQRLKPESGEGHLANAQHFYWGYRDYGRAREELGKARPLLPNEPLLLLLTGYIDRREGQWDKSTQEMERALELDPRNLFILQQVSFNYQNQRRYKEMAAVLDRVVAIQPKDTNTRIQRAIVDREWRGDTRPLHSAFEQISAQDPDALATLIPQWITLALSERDFSAADRALAAAPPDGLDEGGFRYPIDWYRGLIAYARRDENGTRRAFTAARTEIEKIVREQPAYPEALSVLGMIDAALGNKEDAISEGRRATDLLPIAKDALAGASLAENLATIYAWTGEKPLACERLQALTAVPSGVSYGSLRLSPYWDPLRGDACFEKIVASLKQE
jgi:serine/threonine-protein kinase